MQQLCGGWEKEAQKIKEIFAAADRQDKNLSRFSDIWTHKWHRDDSLLQSLSPLAAAQRKQQQKIDRRTNPING